MIRLLLLLVVSLVAFGANMAQGQPANNHFTNAWTLTGTYAVTNGSTSQPSNATKETGEPNHAGFVGGRSVWFNWTAPTNGPVRISTAGSGFNTLLAAYTGTAVNALTQVAANDNVAGQGGNTSRVDFNAQQGTNYWIAVDGRSQGGGAASSGAYILSLQMPGSTAITSPTNGSLVAADAPIPITVQAATPNPPVARVDFYHGGSLFSSTAEEPFVASFANAPLGTNTFVAVATDGAGLSWTSAVLSVVVLNPGVTITTPASGALFLNTNPIGVATVTFLPTGVMTNVEFFVDGLEFGSSATPPFAATWSAVTPGVHRLTAVGHDDAGNTHVSASILIAVAENLIRTNAVWRYLDNGTDQGTNWIASDFDDSGWTNGPAQLGYGDGDEATVVSFGANANAKFTTTYFRHAFVVIDPVGYTNLALRLRRDDGAVVYLNGVETGRFNMPPGIIAYATFASSAVSDDGATFVSANISPSLLIAGTNVLAVEIHQSDLASSDISFELELLGVPAVPREAPPRVLVVLPSPGEVYYLTNVAVTFTEPVGGVDAGDLLVNGVPASSVSSTTNTTYFFGFAQPPFGPVNFTWDTNHAIADLDPVPNSFDGEAPGSMFQFTLLNPSSPTVVASSPPPGAVVTNLTQITVAFSEAVMNVDAGDLLVNGLPATGVSGNGATYTFTFAQPPYGPLAISWTTNHGIEDIEIPASDFDPTRPGGVWSYTHVDPVPFVALIGPTNGAVFQTPVNITLQALATDNDGIITSVEFFAGTNRLGMDTNAPFTVTWLNVASGSYLLTAIATDNSGLSATSAPVNVTVNFGVTALVISGVNWKYLDNGSDQSNAWREASFDDSAWASGPSELGYGDVSDGRPEATVVSFGPSSNNKYVTTYFRHAFTVDDFSGITNLTARLRRDDGAVVYLNGVELFRDNMPTGDVSYVTLAATNVLGPDEHRWFLWNVDPARLVLGTNLIAVEMHQAAANSADLSFDFELLVNLPPEPPTIALTGPTNNATFQTPLTLTLQAAAADNDGTVARVEFFANSSKVGEALVSPFSAAWTNPAAGTYVLLAIATDSSGLMATSAPVSINIIPGPATLIATGAVWRYLDDGSDQSNAWHGLSFDDSAWRSGPAQLGYGDGDEATVVSFGPDSTNKFITTYFRRAFFVADPSVFVSLTLDLLRDDGAVIYLNGIEVHRNSMPSGPIDYRTLAFNGSGAESTFLRIILPPAALATGTNIIAVEIHQDSPTSSDISFDLQLIGVPAGLPLALARGPYLQVGTPTGGIVRWRTDNASDAVVFYGTDPTNLNGIALQSTLTNEHVVQLNGLLPGTKYFYAIGSSSRTLAGGPDYWFATSPTPGTAKPTRLWVLGDPGTAGNGSPARQISTRDAFYNFAATNGPADLWLMLGDNAYDTGTDNEYQRAVFDMYPTTLRNLFLWPAIGNHETGQSTTASTFPYLDIFTLPQNGEAGGVASGTEKYYSFDYANIHFVCLDSMTSGRSGTSPMAQWLQSDLAATAQEWIIVYFHHPPYTKGNHDSDVESDLVQIRQNILPILEAGGVDLVLGGHSHAWERSYLLDGHYGLSSTLVGPMKIDGGDGRVDGSGAYRKNSEGRGVVYNVAGSTGQATGGSLNHPAHFLSLNELGTLVIDVNSNRLDALFLNSSGVVRDRYAIVKPPPAPPANLIARAVTETSIALAWLDLSGDELGFVVERSFDGTNFTQLITLAANTTNLLDTGLLTDVTYFYRVRAFGPFGQSDYSNIASATTGAAGQAPAAPSSLAAASDNGLVHFRSQIILRWRDNSTNESGFQIERSTDGEFYDGIATVGANVTHYLDHGLETATAYFYRVRSVNGAGVSSPSNLAADLTHPQMQIAAVGATVTLHGGVEGAPPVRYQWRYRGAPISGETNGSLILVNIQPYDEGAYSVVVTDANSRVVSNPAMLFVLAPPYIVEHPASRTNTIGSTATFTIVASGIGPLSHQWRRNGLDIPGADGPALVLTNVQPSHAGSYSVEVRNDFGAAISFPALLVINTPPFATPDNLARLPDESVNVDITRLLANDGDPDGDPIHLVSISEESLHGGTVEVTGRYVLYTPPSGFNGDDTFTYTLADGRGGFAVGVVTVVVSDNTPPQLAVIPDYFVNVLQLLVVTNTVEDAETPEGLTASLGFGAPTNARIHPATGRFLWRPTREQAPSTNRVTVIMTDSGTPPLLDATTFTVVVNDYYELTVGSAVLRGGQSGSVPIELFASAGLAQLRCALHFPEDRLVNLSVEPLNAAIGSVTLAESGGDTAVLDFTAVPGQFFQGTQTLARLHFTASTVQNSGFAPLNFGETAVVPLDLGKDPTPLFNSGRVVIVGDQPLLEVGIASSGEHVLALYDQPGQTVLIERTTSLGADAIWRAWGTVTMTNLTYSVAILNGNGQSVFYRARR